MTRVNGQSLDNAIDRLRHAQGRTGSTSRVPHGEHDHVARLWNVVDVIATCCEQESTSGWDGRPSIRASDVRCITDDLERCREFV